MMWPYAVDGSTWLWMTAMMLLFWGGLIALAVWAIRALASPRHTADPALDALRKRLASGEITPDEFERTKKVLGA